MVAFKEEFPYLRTESGQLFEFNRDWLHAAITRAADKAGYPSWWLTDHVIGEPPTRVAGLVRRTGDGSMQPIAIKLEELSRLGPQIWKFFFKCDHDFRLGYRVIPRRRREIELESSRAETIPAGAHFVLFAGREYGWHPQIDRHPQIVGAPTRNVNTPLHQFCAIFRALSLRSLRKELPARWFQVRAQFRPPSPPG